MDTEETKRARGTGHRAEMERRLSSITPPGPGRACRRRSRFGAIAAALLLCVTSLHADPPSGVYSEFLRGYWSFDSVTSTQADDLSGLDHHAELLLTTQSNPGYFGGGALTFGSTSLMVIGNDSHQVIGANEAPFTITFRVRFDTLPAVSTISLLENDDLSLFIGADGTTGELLFADVNNSTFLTSIDLVEEDLWHHVALTYDGTEAILYLDGEEQDSVFGSVDIGNGAIFTGIDSFYGDFLDGELDELRIHSTALTAQEIAFYAALIDADGNGMDDNWEDAYFEQTGIDPDADADGDGLGNRAEFLASTDPTHADTDGDGMSDGWESAHALNPRSAADASADPDGDGYSNLQEYRLGRNPHKEAIPDTTGLVNLVVNRPL